MATLREQREFKEYLQSHPRVNFRKAAKGCECEECGTYKRVYSCEVHSQCWLFLCGPCLANYPNKKLPEPQSNGKSLHMRFAVLARDGFKCVYCGRSVEDGTKLEVDHLYPKSKGGKDNIDNLVTSCWECNHGKGDLIINFRRSQGK